MNLESLTALPKEFLTLALTIGQVLLPHKNTLWQQMAGITPFVLVLVLLYRLLGQALPERRER